MPTRRIIVKGKVQGVGFRYYTSRQAEQLGVTGEVWNRNDGAVEMVAHHPSAEGLDWFQLSLEVGPGRVTEVMGSEEPFQTFDGFRIRNSSS